jgi:Fe-S-cluster-containing hydrogenase component 2
MRTGRINHQDTKTPRVGRPQSKTQNPESKIPAPAGYQRTGVLNAAEAARLGQVPSPARLKQGPVVTIECVEKIPCNPCTAACPRKAITIIGGLVELPKVDFDECNGCTLCIARCPGLAIFAINYNYSKTEATVTMPYELLPRPVKGQKVAALDRAGRKVATGTVVKVLDAPALDRCAVVTVAVPKKLWSEVRSIRITETKPEARSQQAEAKTGRKG